MTSPVRYELVDGIGVITIDNPPVNALSRTRPSTQLHHTTIRRPHVPGCVGLMPRLVGEALQARAAILQRVCIRWSAGLVSWL